LRSIQQQLGEFSEAGIRPVAISVDKPDVSRELCERAGFTFTFLSDPQLDAIRRYDLVHEGQAEDGGGIARPAEFLVDSSGTVRWVNLTENYWVRLHPEDVLEAAKAIQ
jgi:peroxiredoxin